VHTLCLSRTELSKAPAETSTGYEYSQHRTQVHIYIVTSYVTDHSLNLSILLSEGKETNRDFISSGERT
jgi:hypothetical protein